MASIDARGENSWRIRVYAGRDPGTGKKDTSRKRSLEAYVRLSGGPGSCKPRLSLAITWNPRR